MSTIKIGSIILAMSTMFVNSKAQPTFGTTIVENCYQKITAGYTGKAQKVHLIRGLNNLKISSNNYNDIFYWQVLVPDTASRYYLKDDTFAKRTDTFWRIKMDSIKSNGKPVEVYIPEHYDKIRITTPRDWRTGAHQNDTIEIEFVNPEFSLTDKENNCLTFDIARSSILTNLDGLCKKPYIRLSLPRNSVNRWGLPNNWFIDIFDDLPFIKIPINKKNCEDPVHDQNGNLIPYCMNFNADLFILPCNESLLICPPLKVS
jgi:hypothetical protein